MNLQKTFLRAADTASPSGSNAIILLADSCFQNVNMPPCFPARTRACKKYNNIEPSMHEGNATYAAGEVFSDTPLERRGNLLIGAHAVRPGEAAVQPDRMLYGMWTSCLLEALLIEDSGGADILRVLAQTGRLLQHRGCCRPAYSLFTPGALSTVSLARWVTSIECGLPISCDHRHNIFKSLTTDRIRAGLIEHRIHCKTVVSGTAYSRSCRWWQATSRMEPTCQADCDPLQHSSLLPHVTSSDEAHDCTI